MRNKFKSLAIISDCIHVYDQHGNAATENHIFCRQMQELAARFTHTIMVCPFIRAEPGQVLSVYDLTAIDFIPVPQVGGNQVKDKLAILKAFPAWLSAFAKAGSQAEIVYIRMPNNISIPGYFYLKWKGKISFATYTGTWKNYTGEPFTYRFQKWLLKNFYKGPAWIYSSSKTSKAHLLKGYSPSYNETEWLEETEQVRARLQWYNNNKLLEPVFITVGALVPNKNQQYILTTCKQLLEKGLSFKWYIVGDGYMKDQYASFIKLHKLEKQVVLTGKQHFTGLRRLYREANFLVQAAVAEGFGKTPGEAMLHGVIPVLSHTAMSAEMTADNTRGFDFAINDPQSLCKVILHALAQQQLFNSMIQEGRAYVKTQTLENWADDFIKKINSVY